MISGVSTAERENDLEALLSICNELGGYSRVAAKFDQGELAFEKALKAVDILNLRGTEHEATTMLNYATLFVHSNRPDEALEKYRIAEVIYAGLDKANDYRIAALNNNMASLHIKKHDYEKAEKCADRALEIINETGTDGDEIAVTLSLKAQIFAGVGEYEKALGELEKAEAVYASVGDPGVMHTAVTDATFGEVLGKLGRFDEAFARYEKALSAVSKNFGENQNYVSVLRGFAAVKGAAGDSEGKSKLADEADRVEAALLGRTL